jgi:dihydropteroate synthase-like protein
MKVLAVTGKLAEKDVRKYSQTDVHVVDIDVAAFITPQHLQNVDLSDYDLVLVPGLTSADWKRLEMEKGVKIRLGPIHAYDLQFVIPQIERIELSHTIPACRLISKVKTEETKRMVDELEKSFSFKIKHLSVGGDSRMKVVAEIVDSTKLSERELAEKVRYYENSGADVIDLGIPLEVDYEKITQVVELVKEISELPISIDTFDVKAIEKGVDAGVDMVMSISEKNIDALDLIDDQAVVVVERNPEILFELVERVKERTSKVIADPVLDAFPGLIASILRYSKYREIDGETPVLFGAGNVTELSDMDSVGVNGMLAMIAEDIGANLLFTTEASPKTTGSVRELVTASYIVKGAKLRKTPPKDMGINLLVLKEKTSLSGCMPENAFEAKESGEFLRDPLGDFRIWIAGGKIICSHERLTVSGERAKEIYDTVLKKGLLSRLDHACYLGKELMKAEIALKLNKNYTQDQDLNFGIYG